ncbi:MAG: Crp/Fnr family transcriptional regulator [Pseudomonadota bacterium]
MDAIDRLLSCPLFDGMSRDDLPFPANALREIRAAPGQVVITQQDISDEVYFVVEGLTYAAFFHEDGKEMIFTRQREQAYFGEMSALDGSERALSVYAKSQTRLIAMTGKAFRDLLRANAEVQRRVLLDMIARIRELARDRTELRNQSVDLRVRNYIARLALEAHCFFAGGRIEGFPTHAEVANSIGVNREAVSRAMSQLKSLGLIETARGKLTIVDPDRLMPEEA